MPFIFHLDLQPSITNSRDWRRNNPVAGVKAMLHLKASVMADSMGVVLPSPMDQAGVVKAIVIVGIDFRYALPELQSHSVR
jgi:hypothetical protein